MVSPTFRSRESTRRSRSSFAATSSSLSVPAHLTSARARTFIGEETSRTFLYVAVVDQNGMEDFPTNYPLKSPLGKTIEVRGKVGINGVTVDSSGFDVADVTAKFVDTGAKVFAVTVSKSVYPKGAVDKSSNRFVFGANRKASSGQKELTGKVWFGAYTASPLPTLPRSKPLPSSRL